MTLNEAKQFLKKRGVAEADIAAHFKDFKADSQISSAQLSNALKKTYKASDGKTPFSGYKNIAQTTDAEFKKLSNAAERDIRKSQGKFTTLAGDSHGYGMGAKGSINASRLQHGMSYLGAFSPVNAGESLMNAAGMLTKLQRAQYAAGGFGTKALLTTIPLGVAGYSMYSMTQGADPGDIVADNLALAGGITGFRAGKAMGGMATKTGSTVARMAGMGVLGATGFLAGTLAVTGAYEMGKDLTSSQSGIAKAARSTYKRSSTATMKDTRNTLTLRQRTLQKLSSSGMNGRGELLGSEALHAKMLL